MNALLQNRNLIPLSSSFHPVISPPPPVLLAFLPNLTPISVHICVCISLSPYLFASLSLALSQIACHLCDQWNSFFPGNSPVMGFFLFSLLCLCLYVYFFFFSLLLFFGRGCNLLLWIKALTEAKANRRFDVFHQT